MRRFDAVVVGVAAAVLLATLAVVWLGDQTTYSVLAVEPPAGSTAVSTRPTITLRWPHDLDGRSLAGRVRLEPPVAGRLVASGPTARWQPEAALAPDAEYRLVVEPGIRSVGGQVSTLEQRFTFRTRAPRLLLAHREPMATRLAALSIAGDEQPLMTLEPAARDLALSPDGDRLAYVVGAPGGPGDDRLWTLDLPSGERRPVAEAEPVAITRPAWLDDGHHIIYERRVARDEVVERFDLTPPPRQLWSARADGPALGPIYGGAGRTGYQPVPSLRDRLAFFEPNYRAIAIFEAGTPVATLPWNGGTIVGWSPDGTALLVVESAPTAADPARTVVRVLPVPGDPARDLTPPDHSDRAPAWSPDGAQIAVARSGPSGSAIWLLAPDARVARPLPIADDGPATYLNTAWSADARWLAFNRVHRDESAARPEIWLASVGGPAQRIGTGEIVAWLP